MNDDPTVPPAGDSEPASPELPSALPFPAAVPPWTHWSAGGAAATPAAPVAWTSGGAVPPPPPPPPFMASHQWAPLPADWHRAATEAPQRPRSPWLIVGAMAAILGVAFTGGFIADRVASPESRGSGTAGTVSPQVPTGNGGGTGGSGSAPTGSATESTVAAKLTPGIVNVNVTVDGGAAAGTGMVITSTGEVLTNNHVIDGETSIKVELPSTGATYSAHVLGWDATDDVALIQIDGGGTFHTVSIGNSSTVNVGTAVVALGNALGRNGPPSVTSGSITAVNQSITASDRAGGSVETVSGLLQIDAEIQPGDSGGPLATTAGTVVGMDTAAEVSSDRFNQSGSPVAYAIPINNALTIVRQIQAGNSSTTVHLGNTRALLGVGAQDASGGVLVQTVQPGTGAAQAGLTVGSTITALNGQAIASNTALRNSILTHKPGDTVSVTWTDAAGQSHTANVTLSSGPPA